MSDASLTREDRLAGCLLGLACGDAVGSRADTRGQEIRPTEGASIDENRSESGAWSDSTSMALCLATSLIERGGFYAQDQMERYYRWWRDGYLSSTGKCVGIDGTVCQSLIRFEQTGRPFCGPMHRMTAGSAPIARLAPIPMFFAADREAVERLSAMSSLTTHGARECLDACRLFGVMISRALDGAAKEEILTEGDKAFDDRPLTPSIHAIANGCYRVKRESWLIDSGNVARALEAALWCFWSTDTYPAAILSAARFEYHASPIAAICGQIAGAHYGHGAIPDHWLEMLVMRPEIQRMAQHLDSR